jgi:uncharacterized phiE125 gp8 family phage protein
MELNYEAIEEILPLDFVKKAARIDRDDEDELIQSFIYSAVFQIERETGHLFGVREVTESFAGFAAIRLRAAPVREILSVGYHDTANALGTFDITGLRIVMGSRPARVTRLAQSWPQTVCAIDAVQVTFQAGYDPEDMPPTLKTAAVLMVADLYGQRETWTPGSVSQVPLSLGVDLMLQPFRVYSL